MAINAEKPHLWKADTRASVDQFNQWFLKFAPKAYRETRKTTVENVENGLTLTDDLTSITPAILQAHPGILPTLRMSTCPPLARDRLIGLADSTKNLVGSLEEGKIPPRMAADVLQTHLERISRTLFEMRDIDIFPWIEERRRPTQEERYRSSTIVADRLCGAVADPIVRNAQEKRQLALIEEYLTARGYRKFEHGNGTPITQMEPGTFAFRMNVLVTPSKTDTSTVKIPVDAIIQPKDAHLPHLPVLIEAKSAGDFTNVNKRRKEEATKVLEVYIGRQWPPAYHVDRTPLLGTVKHQRITRQTAELVYKRLREEAGVCRSMDARFQPRLHDLRHTFAVVRLVTWYREGKNVQRLLPHLTTYLGHGTIQGTTRYLTMTSELLQEASSCFERYARPEVPHD